MKKEKHSQVYGMCNHCREVFSMDELVDNDGKLYCQQCVDSFVDYIDTVIIAKNYEFTKIRREHAD